jgi:glucokinase
MPNPTKPFVGIDLGGTNMQIGIVSPDLALLAPAKRKTKADEGLDAVLTRIVSGVQEAADAAGLKLTDLGGVGIGAPGAVDPHRGIVLEAVNLRWKDTPLSDLLSKRLKLPVIVDNDVNVAVYGENALGAGKKSLNVAGIWVGTGVGGGLILNGQLFYGHYLSAGEIGHTILLPSNPKGNRSLEHNCSRTTVVDRIVRLIKSGQKSSLADEIAGDFDGIKSKTVAKHYLANDKLVREVVDHAADLLGVAVANLVTLLSLERVILGGGLTEAIGKPFVERVHKSAKDLVFPDACRKFDLVASELEDNAGVFGAAMLAMERLAEPKP